MPNGLILVVDDDTSVRNATARLLERRAFAVECFESGDAFLAAEIATSPNCILLDVRMPGIDGIGVLRVLRKRGTDIPVIVISGHGDIPLAVEAMREGASDFLEKPYSPDALFEALDRAMAPGPAAQRFNMIDPEARESVRQLSSRQRQVLRGILRGQPNKIIAFELGLSTRTVEAYRAQLFARLGVRSTSEAVKAALAAGLSPADVPAGPVEDD